MLNPPIDLDNLGRIPYQPGVRPLLDLGGTYNATNLHTGSRTLPPIQQRALRQVVRKFTPWLKSRGLVTPEQFAALWSFSHSPTGLQLSTLSRARLEHAIGGMDRRTRYSTIRRNALFMLALGLGIRPTTACTITIPQLEKIRTLHKRLGCYTQWAWSYIDKLVTARRYNLKPGRGSTVNKCLFVNMDGTIMSPTFAMDLADRWPEVYGLSLPATIRAHRTLSVELAGVQPQIDSLYKEIFGYETNTPRTPTTAYPQPPSETTPVTTNETITITHYRAWISTHWLAARRHKAIHQYLSRHRAEPLDSDPRQA